jgi:hypothetical protein
MTVAGGKAEPNRIANLVAERPDQIWVSDIAEAQARSMIFTFPKMGPK